LLIDLCRCHPVSYRFDSGASGFEKVIHLWRQIQECRYEQIQIDWQHIQWLDANLCSPLGAILYKTGRNLNSIEFINLQRDIEIILSKNNFLSTYGRERRKDTYGTTIEYKRFEIQDDRYFTAYIQKYLTGKGIPEMTPALQKKFQENIFEIFFNAVTHSRTQLGIFSCGQFFPNKTHLDFTITDLGIGFCQNVNQALELTLSPEMAIDWAMQEGNTTRKDDIPGGLGLKLLFEFIKKNRGKIQIVSDRGFWTYYDGNTSTHLFSNPFPGSVVNIQINTADPCSYYLASEIHSEEIF